jgi:cullin 1
LKYFQLVFGIWPQVLETLTSSNLLVTENSMKASDFTEDTIFTLNTDYKNQRYRVALPSTLVFEKKADADKGDRRIRNNRMFILQACIVRIMKARQIIQHRDLELEVVKQTLKQFFPDSAMIKVSSRFLSHTY